MKLTPENLMSLPVGKYLISRIPYVTSPHYVETNELHVWDNKGEKGYYIGRFGDRFTLLIEPLLNDKGETVLTLSGVTTIANNSFRMTQNSEYNLTKYEVELPS